MKFEIKDDEIKIYDFNTLEAYRIARHMEKEGIDFYCQLKGHLTGPRFQKTIEHLLQEERKHLALFQTKIDQLLEGVDDPYEGDHVVDVVNTKIFNLLPKTDDISQVVSNKGKALKLGILIEKRSIAFYQELLRYTTEESGQKALQELIAEEERHQEQLYQLLPSLP